MRPSHFIRINPTIPTLHALPQLMSTVGKSQTRSYRSFRSDLASRRVLQNSLSKQRQKGIEISSSTMLKNSAIPIAASSTSLVGVAFVSAISAGIFSGGLHAIAGAYVTHSMQLVL